MIPTWRDTSQEAVLTFFLIPNGSSCPQEDKLIFRGKDDM